MNSDLNSALALFRSLYKAQKGDVFTIVERFILVGVKSKGLMSFTIEEVSDLLKETFNVTIPFSVIRKCIVSNQEVFQYAQKKYIVIKPMDDEIDAIVSEMNEREVYKEEITADFLAFVESLKDKQLSEDERIMMGQLFFDFLVDKEHVEDTENRLLITRYIIEKESDARFQDFLNSIREGMVIYKGIRYSDSPNDTSWGCDTDFFLDEEYLFGAYGMNGEFYQKCFFEFYDLVEEINKSSVMRGGRKRIRLFYFPETRKDVEAYFMQAIRIRRMQERYLYPQVAMDAILNACREDVDIERYKTNFYRRLKDLSIVEYVDDIDIKRNQDYIFENADFEKKKDMHFNPDQYGEVNDYLKIADYINILRQGKSSYPLEKCKFMFLSDGNLSNELSRFIREYTEKKSLVITRMGNFTELMWFKLKKGVVGESSSATISVVNKAKTVVSGLLYDNLKKQYDAVLAMDADDNAKKEYYAELRTKRYSPEDISSESIANDAAFIDDVNYLEKYKQTQEDLKKQAAEAVELKEALKHEEGKNEMLECKVNELGEYIKKEELRKFKGAVAKARKRFSLQGGALLRNYIWLIGIVIFLLFALPSFFFMDLTWVNIVAVGGTFITLSGFALSYCFKKKEKMLAYIQARYRGLVEKEMRKVGQERG